MARGRKGSSDGEGSAIATRGRVCGIHIPFPYHKTEAELSRSHTLELFLEFPEFPDAIKKGVVLVS
jgi:hypothetical protein